MTRFPSVLHEMLVCSDSNEIARRIASWSKCGKFFTIHDRSAFEKTLLPKFYKHKKYKSFVRQLHMYNFQRVPGTKSKQSYFHVDFHRDFPELCELVLRKGSTGETVGTSKPKPSPMITSSSQTSCISSPNPQEFSGMSSAIHYDVSPLAATSSCSSSSANFDFALHKQGAVDFPKKFMEDYADSFQYQKAYEHPSSLFMDVELILGNSENEPLFRQDEREVVDIIDEIVNTFGHTKPCLL